MPLPLQQYTAVSCGSQCICFGTHLSLQMDTLHVRVQHAGLGIIEHAQRCPRDGQSCHHACKRFK